MKFVKKISSPNFLVKEFYTQKTCKSRFFMSWGPLVLPSSIHPFVRPYQFFSFFSFFSSPLTWPVSAVAIDSPQSPDSPNSSDSPDSPQQVWKTSGAWKLIKWIIWSSTISPIMQENALLFALEKITQFISNDHSGPGIQCAWKNAEFVAIFCFLTLFCRNFRHLLPFAAIYWNFLLLLCKLRLFLTFFEKKCLGNKKCLTSRLPGSTFSVALRPPVMAVTSIFNSSTVYCEMR